MIIVLATSTGISTINKKKTESKIAQEPFVMNQKL